MASCFFAVYVLGVEVFLRRLQSLNRAMTSFTAGFKHHHHINAKNALTLQLGQDQTFCLETGELRLEPAKNTRCLDKQGSGGGHRRGGKSRRETRSKRVGEGWNGLKKLDCSAGRRNRNLRNSPSNGTRRRTNQFNRLIRLNRQSPLPRLVEQRQRRRRRRSTSNELHPRNKKS